MIRRDIALKETLILVEYCVHDFTLLNFLTPLHTSYTIKQVNIKWKLKKYITSIKLSND